MIILITLKGFLCAVPYGGGTGTPEDPYQIWTAEQMNTIGLNPSDWSKSFKLMADIDLSAYTGKQFNPINQFTGNFDGGGKIISNFTYVADNPSAFVSLFINVRPGGQVKALRITNVNVTGSSTTGGLVAYNYGIIADCYVSGNVSGGPQTGGAVGSNESAGKIIGTVSVASVTADGGSVGGLTGFSAGTIDNCYARGSVTGTAGVGGLLGVYEKGNVGNCYSTGRVSGNSAVGGLIGTTNAGSCMNSFWDIETSGRMTSACGVGKTSNEMKDINTYLGVGWDFVGEETNGTQDIWIMPINEGYPQLSWQTQNSEIYDIRVAPGSVYTTISWRTANYADSVVEYGPTTDYQYRAMGDPGTVHAVHIQLVPGTWHYRVQSTDRAGGPLVSDDRWLFGGGEPTTIRLSSIAVSVVNSTTAIISWTTNIPTSGLDTASVWPEVGTTKVYEVSVPSPTIRHSITCTNLQPNLIYFWWVKSNGSVAGDGAPFRTGSGGITNVHANPRAFDQGLKGAGATVSWATPVPANSTVEYEGPGTNGIASVSDGTLVTNHQIDVKGLDWATEYRYRVQSTDAHGNTCTSDWKTFTTGTINGSLFTEKYSNLERLSNGKYQVDLLIINIGSTAYSGITVGFAYLGPKQASAPVFPTSSFGLQSGETKTITVTFPSLSGTPGSNVQLYFGGYYPGVAPFKNKFKATFHVTLP